MLRRLRRRRRGPLERFPVHRELRDRLRALLAAGDTQRREIKRWRAAGEPIGLRPTRRLRRANEEFASVALEIEDFLEASVDDLAQERERARQIGPDTLARVGLLEQAAGSARTFSRIRGVETRELRDPASAEEAS